LEFKLQRGGFWLDKFCEESYNQISQCGETLLQYDNLLN